MDNVTSKGEKITKSFVETDNPRKLLLTVIVVSVVLGVVTGFVLNSKGKSGLTTAGLDAPTAKSAQTDTKTFKDFAEGVIKARPEPSDPEEYVEGTHVLIRDAGVPVALTSSVVDLSKYEGRKVKVFGETQKALKEGWLMDVGKVEETRK